MAKPKSRHQHTAMRKQRAKRKFAFLRELRRDTIMQPSAKMVVWSLAEDFYNLDDERCNPSFASLARAVGRRQRSVIDAIGEAKTRGWIEVSSIGGGSKRSTNRYAIVWDKRADMAPGQAAEKTDQAIEDIEETASAAPENSQSTQIIDENEIEVCSTLHGCSPLHGGMQSSAYEPTPNLKGEEEEEDAAVAARGFAAPPLAEEDEMAFQQLWEMWQTRERFYPRGDLAKSREAFAAICIEHGEEISTTYGMEPRDFILARAKFWLDGIESPKFLKTLEAWLGGAPDSQGRTDHFWLREPTAPTRGRRGSKPDLLKVALRGAERAAS
jgi:Helix-turn-helix domain